jgi:hypothetical protein
MTPRRRLHATTDPSADLMAVSTRSCHSVSNAMTFIGTLAMRQLLSP